MWTGVIYDKKISTTSIRKTIMNGREMNILPYSEWMKFSWDEVRMLLHETATYTAPTEELIDFLDNLIGQERTIEICAGNGFIGRELGILTTDSYQQQDDKKSCAIYDMIKQPRIKYPPSVIKLEASKAVRQMKPHTVIGCYATHKWRDDTQSGNWKGVDFEDVFAHIKRLILVGNLTTHKDNPLMKLPHEEIYLHGLLTRSIEQHNNRVFIWEH